MRLIVFFDLPVQTSKQRAEYAKFRKNLIKEGFLMMQESVYTKLAINRQTLELEAKRIEAIIPHNGLIQILTVTERQFAGIFTILGHERVHNELDDTTRLVIL